LESLFGGVEGDLRGAFDQEPPFLDTWLIFHAEDVDLLGGVHGFFELLAVELGSLGEVLVDLFLGQRDLAAFGSLLLLVVVEVVVVEEGLEEVVASRLQELNLLPAQLVHIDGADEAGLDAVAAVGA